ncbi:hypothetical protein PCG10_003988 [Penicillium crustosum]|uniref:Uncharacterized protein n=1 Tax=Penicillium crustosum TaxID=36656 RepID=A0A9P5L1N3_PENCR|nr:hypothetical protein PCG10_003988 [Penicillium crustosum]
MVVCMLFTMGSVEEAQKSSFPIIEICRQATGSVKAATAMVSGLAVGQPGEHRVCIKVDVGVGSRRSPAPVV